MKMSNQFFINEIVKVTVISKCVNDTILLFNCVTL